MSVVDEDVELRDLLAQTLEKNGCLAKIRAQLRASTFLALDEDIRLSKQQPLQNLQVQTYLDTPEGKIMFYLVREFLEFFNLQCTLSVYETESYLDRKIECTSREKFARDLGLDDTNTTVPLLQQVLKIAQHENHKVNGSNIKETSSSSIKTDVGNNNIKNNDLLSNLNKTFEITSPMYTSISYKKTVEPKVNGLPIDNLLKVPKNTREDDTYEDTSSIAEDSEANEVPLKSQQSSNTPPQNSSISEFIQTESTINSKK
ncbi:hypothetical protein ABEB36_007252 [Hypothenemus hampei]|uniref:FGFR1 oncogene partner (FOP) N-terminal dimerisation domain-containing protein n=1 Tax=Hypothenemus hampei TaxID=57062 RepID=A0ABD1EWF5_HYPHA